MSSYLAICLLALAANRVHGYASPYGLSPLAVAPVLDHYSYPKYSYNYGVNDPWSGDSKSQWETRDGDAVKGSYSLVEPDGQLRVVDYSSSALTGFNAVVSRIGPNLHSTGHHLNTIAIAPALAPLPLAPLASMEPKLASLEPIMTAPAHIITPIAPAAVSTSNMVRGGGPSIPYLRTNILPLIHGPMTYNLGAQVHHGMNAAELPLQAGYGGIPWGPLPMPVAMEPLPAPEPAHAPYVTISALKNGSPQWSTGPIQVLDGHTYTIKRKA